MVVQYPVTPEPDMMIGKVVVGGLLLGGIVVYFMPKSKPAKKIRRVLRQSPISAAFR